MVPEAVVFSSRSLRSLSKNFLFRQTHRVARDGGLLNQKVDLHIFHVLYPTEPHLVGWRHERGRGVVPTFVETVVAIVQDGRQFGAAAAGLA